MWNNMTGTTPGDHFVTVALVQQIHYLNFADSGLATSFLITKGGKKKKKTFLNHCQIFLYFTQNLFTQVVFYLPLKLT